MNDKRVGVMCSCVGCGFSHQSIFVVFRLSSHIRTSVWILQSNNSTEESEEC
jgi:hypothetical protein